jgi:diadenosine tetraphosphate (Ap4A) HIT family hydrolase
MSSKLSTAFGHLDSVAYEVEAALAFHDDNPKAAIATLLADVRHLRSQLALAEAAMSAVMTRGWKPKFDRE